VGGEEEGEIIWCHVVSPLCEISFRAVLLLSATPDATQSANATQIKAQVRLVQAVLIIMNGIELELIYSHMKKVFRSEE